ncbi:pentapeptide repeat-containing protein [Nocardia xishanensis]|uniref:pentapeptide repeat-containing protein n=1 Tax=Nocardia xishanensis TaxID=238964 RepID=UPI000AEAD405|nr:pentapeptide repeat-containing protein [Nocardia xishanensis]
MEEFGERSYEVRVWPVDRAASTALHEYIRIRTAPGEGLRGVLGGAGLNFHGADLRDLDLSDAYLAMADFDGVNLAGADLDRATLLGTKLHNSDLSGANLHKAEADGCEGEGVNLSGANLFRASFVKSRLRQANLRGCGLSSTNFRQADLRGADLRGCHFGPTATRLSEAQLSGAKVAMPAVRCAAPVLVDGQLLAGRQLEECFAAMGPRNTRGGVTSRLNAHLVISHLCMALHGYSSAISQGGEVACPLGYPGGQVGVWPEGDGAGGITLTSCTPTCDRQPASIGPGDYWLVVMNCAVLQHHSFGTADATDPSIRYYRERFL